MQSDQTLLEYLEYHFYESGEVMSLFKKKEKAAAFCCPVCGTPLEPDATFCIECGTPVNNMGVQPDERNCCSVCGTPLNPDDVFSVEHR